MQISSTRQPSTAAPPSMRSALLFHLPECISPVICSLSLLPWSLDRNSLSHVCRRKEDRAGKRGGRHVCGGEPQRGTVRSVGVTDCGRPWSHGPSGPSSSRRCLRRTCPPSHSCAPPVSMLRRGPQYPHVWATPILPVPTAPCSAPCRPQRRRCPTLPPAAWPHPHREVAVELPQLPHWRLHHLLRQLPQRHPHPHTQQPPGGRRRDGVARRPAPRRRRRQ